MSGFEFQEVLELKRDLLDLRKNTGRATDRAAEKIAQIAIRRVKQLTPVDKGDLRNNWKYMIVKKSSSYLVIIYNQLYYAGWVENGHRQEVGRFVPAIGKRLVKPWVEGRFMLKISSEEVGKMMPAIWEEEIEKEMRRLFG